MIHQLNPLSVLIKISVNFSTRFLLPKFIYHYTPEYITHTTILDFSSYLLIHIILNMDHWIRTQKVGIIICTTHKFFPPDLLKKSDVLLLYQSVTVFERPVAMDCNDFSCMYNVKTSSTISWVKFSYCSFSWTQISMSYFHRSVTSNLGNLLTWRQLFRAMFRPFS